MKDVNDQDKQRNKFVIQFTYMLLKQDEKVYNKWDKVLFFALGPSGHIIPYFSSGFIEGLSMDIKLKYEKLRADYLAGNL